MGFGSYLANGFKTLTFDKQAVPAIRDEPSSFRYALILTTLLATLAGLIVFGFAALVTRLSGDFPDPIGVTPVLFGLGAFVITFVLIFLSAGVTHLLAKAFGGIATIAQYYAVALSITFAISIINIPISFLSFIPFLGILVSIAFGLYSLAVSVFTVRETYSLSTGKAIVIVLIPLILLFVLVMVFMTVFFLPFLV